MMTSAYFFIPGPGLHFFGEHDPLSAERDIKGIVALFEPVEYLEDGDLLNFAWSLPFFTRQYRRPTGGIRVTDVELFLYAGGRHHEYAFEDAEASTRTGDEHGASSTTIGCTKARNELQNAVRRHVDGRLKKSMMRWLMKGSPACSQFPSASMRISSSSPFSKSSRI